MNARIKEATIMLAIIALLLLTRITLLETALFISILIALYLPGFLLVNYILKQKYEAIETHVFSFTLGTAMMIFTSFAGMQFSAPIIPLTVIIYEAVLVAILAGIIWK